MLVSRCTAAGILIRTAEFKKRSLLLEPILRHLGVSCIRDSKIYTFLKW